MKTKEFVNKVKSANDLELMEMLMNEKKGLYELRQRKAMRQLDNPHALDISRKNIARILTEVRARELKG